MKGIKKDTLNIIAMFTAMAIMVFLLPVDSFTKDKQPNSQVEALINVFTHPKARDDNLSETNQVIDKLVAIGTPAVPLLIKAILGDNENVAAYSALAMDRIGRDAVDIVNAKWKTLAESDKWKLMSFKGNHDYEASLEFALLSLSSRDDNIRRNAIQYLGQYKEIMARDILLKALSTEVPRLRWNVIEALTKIGGEQVVDAFILLLLPESWVARGVGLQPPAGEVFPWWPDGRFIIIEALGKLRAKRSAAALLKVLQEKGQGKAYLGSFIIPLFGEFTYIDGVPELKRILAKGPDDMVKLLSARTLYQLGDKTGKKLLLKELGAKEWNRRRFACETFALFGDKADIPALVSCLNDQDWGVLKAACCGLERITGVVNRSEGWAECTEHDAPLWKVWWKFKK